MYFTFRQNTCQWPSYCKYKQWILNITLHSRKKSKKKNERRERGSEKLLVSSYVCNKWKGISTKRLETRIQNVKNLHFSVSSLDSPTALKSDQGNQNGYEPGKLIRSGITSQNLEDFVQTVVPPNPPPHSHPHIHIPHSNCQLYIFCSDKNLTNYVFYLLWVRAHKQNYL